MAYRTNVRNPVTLFDRLSRRFGGAVFLAMLGGCAVLGATGLANDPIEGRIVDARDGKPIANAFVFVRWRYHGSAAGVHSLSSCPYLEVTRSDANGRYSFPKAPRANSENFYRSVSAYVPGFEHDFTKRYKPPFNYPDAEAEDRFDESNVFMKSFEGDGDLRVESFRQFHSLMSCGKREERFEKLAPMYQAIDAEYAMLHVEKKQNKWRYSMIQDLTAVVE
jgi:hypothetical protein